ncbi:MAG TPA: sugar phosphate nucleotidyltransferase [Roseiarcus sp.]|jgi:D-glycero-D-manno-heptose 1,7-bisphosphate phosphatase
MSGAIRQALILAGGKGTRLGAITQAIPKPMLRIAGEKPFLDYLIEMIERHGYEDILLLGGYLGEVLEAAYDGRRVGGATIRVLLEKAPLGTAGALTIARPTLDPRFLMMNGDAFFDINLRALEQASREGGAMATLALRSVPDASRYGRVIERKGKVVAFSEKDPSRPGPGIINGGVYVLKREILDLVSALPCSLEQNVFPTLVERGQIRGKAFDGYFLDIGLPETLEQGHSELPNVRVRPAAFFDRRALVGGGAGDSGAIQWTAGAVEAIRALNDHGYYVFVMSGAGDGGRSNAAMQERLAAGGAHVDRFYSEAGFASGPLSGSAGTENPFAKAMDERPVTREKSFFIGAEASDISAARDAGLAAHRSDGGDLARLVEGLLARSAQG